jgi:hypothetical protein
MVYRAFYLLAPTHPAPPSTISSVPCSAYNIVLFTMPAIRNQPSRRSKSVGLEVSRLRSQEYEEAFQNLENAGRSCQYRSPSAFRGLNVYLFTATIVSSPVPEVPDLKHQRLTPIAEEPIRALVVRRPGTQRLTLATLLKHAQLTSKSSSTAPGHRKANIELSPLFAPHYPVLEKTDLADQVESIRPLFPEDIEDGFFEYEMREVEDDDFNDVFRRSMEVFKKDLPLIHNLRPAQAMAAMLNVYM